LELRRDPAAIACVEQQSRSFAPGCRLLWRQMARRPTTCCIGLHEIKTTKDVQLLVLHSHEPCRQLRSIARARQLSCEGRQVTKGNV
jgi:hypothetical protein